MLKFLETFHFYVIDNNRSGKITLLSTYSGRRVGLLAHLVFYQKSLCNHDLSVVHSCQCHWCHWHQYHQHHQCWHHWHLCTALLATGFKIETSYLV